MNEETETRDVIFYGAGNNLREHFDEWFLKYNPVCVIDADPDKQHTRFLAPSGSLDILPLLDAVQRYPNYVLYCTQISKNIDAVVDYLITSGVPIDRIKACLAGNARYPGKSCGYLDRNYIIVDNFPTNYSYCCMPNRRTWRSSGDFMLDFAHNIRNVNRLKECLEHNLPSSCFGCPEIHNDLRKPQGKYVVNLSTGIYGGHTCNFRCIYCVADGVLHHSTEQKESAISSLSILQQIAAEFDAKDMFIEYNCGEIGISKYRDEILKLWAAKRWNGSVATNASVWLPGLARLLSEKLADILVSLDSGTGTTFQRVKRVDGFGRVVDNLKRYAETGRRIRLKYLLIDGINDNIQDVDGFADLAADLKVSSVILSRDVTKINANMSLSEYNAAIRLRDNCEKHTIPFIVQKYFTNEDLAKELFNNKLRNLAQ
jgi:pyruvate-formate lyase-activating enzyme